MDTKQAAELLGTSPRTLRQFLRSSGSTFRAVGSSARYEFTEAQIPTLRKRFAEWSARGKGANKAPQTPVTARTTNAATVTTQDDKDRAVWAEEGPVVIPDIRDPRIRARVRADARAAEDRLMMRLLATGHHITQKGDRVS